LELAFRHVAPPSPCGYLPDQVWRLEYVQVLSLSPAEYEEHLQRGWRRFGHALFRPRCPSCTACWPLRVCVADFRPNRSQRRARKLNQNAVRLAIGRPLVSAEKLDLYDRFHAFQSAHRHWPEHDPKNPHDYAASFVSNPFPTQEWCYFLNQELVGVGYVDQLPRSLSAVYFLYDPAERRRSLGTWNVLSVIQRAAELGLPHVYLGYYVRGCGSMAYKAAFVANEILGNDGKWHHFRP
jgi:leucyl-tRNA---protein transferase